MFIDLSSEPTLLNKFIEKDNDGNHISPMMAFHDDIFSDNDIELMNFVFEKFGSKSAKDLVSYNHRLNSPRHNTAKENSVLELLENEVINNTEFLIDMSQIISHDERKLDIYADYHESH